MGWALPTSIEKAILPFVDSSHSSMSFDSDAEKAVVFCLTELSRQKGGSFFNKQEPEKLLYISKAYYPFWLAPLRETTLLLDGLNVASHAITYPVLPDIKDFKQKLTDRSASGGTHENFLTNYQNYFKNPSKQEKTVIDGLFNDAEFAVEFLNYAKEATKTNSTIVDAVLITPALDEDGVGKMVQNVENTRLKLSADVADLNDTIKLLNSKTQESKASIEEETKATEEKFSLQIQKIKTEVDAEVSKINKTYMDKVTEVTNNFTDETTNLQKEILKARKETEQLDAEIERVEAEIKTAAINKDDSSEQKWKDKRNELKDQRPEKASKIKELEKQVAELEENRKSELFQLKQDNDAKVKEAGNALVEVEAARDAEIKTCHGGMERIEELTSNIIEQVDVLVKNREATLYEFDELGTKQQTAAPSLIYMPFYLSCYQSKSNKRCSYTAPSVVSDGGLGTRLKAMGKTKISIVLQPRSRKIVSILNSFIALLDENIVFNHEISEACLRTNLLREDKGQTWVMSGLTKLKEQGWLSDSEFESFSQAVAQSFR
jgi:hypothetical protein